MAMPAQSLRDAAESQWLAAGGSILLHDAKQSALAASSRNAFALLQTASALDHAGLLLREELRILNAGEETLGAKRPCVDSHMRRPITAAAEDKDDVSDGSALQGGLISSNVRPAKPQVLISAASEHRAPDGTLRLLSSNLLSADECATLVAGGLVAMAGAFSRCGQTTLGLSPALAARMVAYSEPATAASHAAAAASIPEALPLLYRTVERVRRKVAFAFGAKLETLRMSDATLTRLQPVEEEHTHGAHPPRQHDAGSALRAATASGALDVGLLRGDQFNYWRPHLDKVSVDEYEFSALLYLTRHGDVAQGAVGGGTAGGGPAGGGAVVDVSDAAADSPRSRQQQPPPQPQQQQQQQQQSTTPGDFTGGRLVFFDEDADRVVHPEPGLLVAFTSGAPNLHAVHRVTSGSRFALTMWFTSRKESAAAQAAADPTHVAMQQWAASLPPAALAASSGAAHPCAAAASAASLKLPSREESLVSAALCSLPANDPLGRTLILATPGQRSEALSRGVDLPAEHAHAAPLLPAKVLEGADASVAASVAASAPGTVAAQLVGRAGGTAAPAPPHPLLQPRIAMVDALLTTLRRARAQHACQEVTAAASAGAGALTDQHAKPAEEDAFSVFD